MFFKASNPYLNAQPVKSVAHCLINTYLEQYPHPELQEYLDIFQFHDHTVLDGLARLYAMIPTDFRSRTSLDQQIESIKHHLAVIVGDKDRKLSTSFLNSVVYLYHIIINKRTKVINRKDQRKIFFGVERLIKLFVPIKDWNPSFVNANIIDLTKSLINGELKDQGILKDAFMDQGYEDTWGLFNYTVHKDMWIIQQLIN